MHTTEQAIAASIRALKNGMNVNVLKSALVSDGFKDNKAVTIIRWASQFIQKTKTNEKVSSAPLVGRKRSVPGTRNKL